MATAAVGLASNAKVFAAVPYVGWAVGLAAAYIDQTYLYPALAGDPDEAREPQLASLPVSQQGVGAPRSFALGARMRLPSHVMYQSEKVREQTSGGGKGGTDVAVKRVYVSALIHLNDRRSRRLLQLIGNGQLILFSERNLLGITTDAMTAAVDGTATDPESGLPLVLISLNSPIDGDFSDVFKKGDLIKPTGFRRVSGPTIFNDTYFEVFSILPPSGSSGGSMKVMPIDGQTVTGLSFTGGTAFSPSRITRIDDAVGGTQLIFDYRVTYPSSVNRKIITIRQGWDPRGTNTPVTQVFQIGDRVRVRNTPFWGSAGEICTVVDYQPSAYQQLVLSYAGTALPNPFNNSVFRRYHCPGVTQYTLPSGVPNPFGKPFIVEMAEGASFAPEVFPVDFDQKANFNEGDEDQGQPQVLTTDVGSDLTSNYRGMATQGIEECYVSVFGDQLPTNLECILDIDDEMTWAQALEALLQRGDLRNTQIDTSGVPSRPFRGGSVRGSVAVIKQIQPVLVAGQILTQERDGVVALFETDNADIVQVENGTAFTDLGCKVFGQPTDFDKVQTSDANETDMPTSVGIRFQDPDQFYSTGYEHFGLRNPSGSDHTNEQIIDLSSTVLTRRECKDLSSTILRRAWINRRKYRLTLPSAYIHLLENDLITFTDDEGEVITARIIQRDIGSNFLVNVTALREMTGMAVIGSPVQSSSTVVPQQTGTTTALAVTAIDAPAISNSEINTPAIRLGVADLSGNLQTATVWESQDGNSYQPVGTIGGTCALGFLLSELTAQTSSEAYGTTTVSLRSQTVTTFWSNTGSDVLEACTQAQAESGKNWCAIIGTASEEVEIAAFTTVVNNGDGTYTLGGWLRGLRGTPSPAQSDKTLVMMNQSVGGLFWREFSGPTPTSLAYKVVPSGGDLATTEATTVTAPKFRNVLPLPIRSVIRTYDSTALTTRFEVAAHWERQLLPLGTQPPHTMDEPFESYRINIYQHGSTDVIAATYLMDSRTTGASTLRDTYFDWSNVRSAAAGYTPGPSETYYVSYQQVGEYGDGPLRFETI